MRMFFSSSTVSHSLVSRPSVSGIDVSRRVLLGCRMKQSGERKRVFSGMCWRGGGGSSLRRRKVRPVWCLAGFFKRLPKAATRVIAVRG